MAIDEVVTLILLLQNLQGIWCDNILILSQLIRQMKSLSQQNTNFFHYILSRFFLKWSVPSIINDEDKFFPMSFLEGFMGQLITQNKFCATCMLEKT